MRISIHTNDKNYLNEIKYVIDFIDNHPLKPQEVVVSFQQSDADTLIYYTSEKKMGSIWMPRQGVIFSNKVIESKELFCNVYRQADDVSYSVENIAKGDTSFYHDSSFGFDLIEMIFFHISRYEEYHCKSELKDQWGMMHENHHFSVLKNTYHIPVVDHLVQMFFTALGITIHNEPTKYAMTHDIDVLAKFENVTRKLRSTIRSTMDHGLEGLKQASKTIANVSKGEINDPYDTFQELFTKRTFDRKICFVMAGGETKHDNYYNISSPNAASMMKTAQENGYEIGLHPSYNAGYKEALFTKEKHALETILNKEVVSSRQHFLRYDFDTTPHIIESSKIETDSTLGYQRLIGYRCGTGFSYHLFDFKKREKFIHKELPMVIMDGGLLDEANQDLDTARELLSQFLLKNKDATYITFNFHNTIFDPLKRDVNKMLEIYQMCLETA